MTGDCGGGTPTVANVRPSTLTENVVAAAKPDGTTDTPNVTRMNAPTLSNTAISGEKDRIARWYAKQNAATPARPSTVASAALLANSGPRSIARKTDTGPDVRGNPESQPPIDWPHRRAAMVATPTSSGVRISLSNSRHIACRYPRACSRSSTIRGFARAALFTHRVTDSVSRASGPPHVLPAPRTRTKRLL